MMLVYTDGSKINAPDGSHHAGVGVWFGASDPRNSSIVVRGCRPTNQVAELLGIRYALTFCAEVQELKIFSDSKYAINCVTQWCGTWQRNGQKTSAGGEVSNRDTIESILSLILLRDSLGKVTVFEHVYGHTGNEGNSSADLLAKSTAKESVREHMSDVIYFYSHTHGPYACLSQFYRCEFSVKIDGAEVFFNYVEQHHHYSKAVLFGDLDTADMILKSQCPKDQLILGRSVKNFDFDVWSQKRLLYCRRGNEAKFGQNPKLMEVLLSTKGKRLVEASPTNSIWGIGISMDEARLQRKWKGMNLLGNELVRLRDDTIG